MLNDPGVIYGYSVIGQFVLEIEHPRNVSDARLLYDTIPRNNIEYIKPFREGRRVPRDLPHDWGPFLFHAAWMAIVLLTLFPYQILPEETVSSRQDPFLLWFFEKYPDGFDVFLNILLFAPFALGVGWRLDKWKVRWPVALLLTCAASGTFSFWIELAQKFMPTRTSSWFDVLANTTGGSGSLGRVKLGRCWHSRRKRSSRRQPAPSRCSHTQWKRSSKPGPTLNQCSPTQRKRSSEPGLTPRPSSSSAASRAADAWGAPAGWRLTSGSRGVLLLNELTRQPARAGRLPLFWAKCQPSEASQVDPHGTGSPQRSRNVVSAVGLRTLGPKLPWG